MNALTQHTCQNRDPAIYLEEVFFFQAEDGIRDGRVTGVQTCALPIYEIIAAAHLRMRAARPDLLTVIVPRHPERGPLIAAQLQPMSLTVALRSEGKLPEASTDIYVADTIGELGLFYALSPVAFVGGSLAERGGQNPVEPIKLGAAVLTGPHVQNFRDAYTALLRVGGCKQVS